MQLKKTPQLVIPAKRCPRGFTAQLDKQACKARRGIVRAGTHREVSKWVPAFALGAEKMRGPRVALPRRI